MKKVTGIMISIVLIGSMLPWMALSERVCAASNVPVTMEIPLQLTDSTQDAYADNAGQGLQAEVFTLAALSSDAPMPEDAVNGEKTLTLREAKETSFGPIRYDRPGVYDYTVRASDADAPVYRVQVVAANDGQGSMIIRRDGQEGKTELVYQGIPSATADDPGDPSTEKEASGSASSEGKESGRLTSEGALGITPILHHSVDESTEKAGLVGTNGMPPRTGEATPVVLWILLWTGSLLTLLLLLAASGFRPWKKTYPSKGMAMETVAKGSRRNGAVREDHTDVEHTIRRKQHVRISLCILLMLCLLIPAAEESVGASTKVTVHRHGTCRNCGAKRGDGRNGWTKITYDNDVGLTYYRWISYVDPATGKKCKVDTYCMEPSKVSPREGSRTAVLLDAAKTGKQQNIARVLYFANGGPGEDTLKEYLKENQSTYPDFQTAKGQFAMMHILLAYAADPDEAFKVIGWGGSTSKSVNGELSSGFQKKIRKLYRWCQKHAVIVTNPSFSIRPATATAKMDEDAGGFLSQQMRVTGSDSRQFFRYKVPNRAKLLLLHAGQETAYAAGRTVSIHVGDRFRILLSAERSSGIKKKTVIGALSKMKPYRIRSSGSQDLGFYVSQAAVTADFSVAMIRDGEGTGEDTTEPDPTNPTSPADDQPQNENTAQSDSLSTYTLQVTKKLQASIGKMGQMFDFRASFHGLIRDRYLMVRSGKASAEISADQEGTIAVRVTDSTWLAGRSGDLSGIPVKLTRSDGSTRTLFTGEDGKISAGAYTDWLREAAEDHRFQIEFLQRTFIETW